MRTTLQQKVILSLMVIALGLVLLFASGMLGMAGYGLIALSSVFMYVLTDEGLYASAGVSFVITSAIAWFIVPDKISAIVYILIFGHYPLFKSCIDRSSLDKATGMCLKLIYCNLFVIIGLCIVLFGLKQSIPDIKLPKYLAVAILELAFIVIDLVHSFCRWVYLDKLRSGIIHKK